LNECGLFYFDERKKKYVERFRNRIIFPINNISGNPIGIGGRILEQNKNLAKYINSPETEFFKKGSNLFNLDNARKLSNKVDDIYLVEGYMDVIGLHKNGIENVVANLGTSLTNRQILVLNQFFENIIICFDGDESGYKAALRAAENSIVELKPEKKISFLFLPDNHDPDSFANKHGKEYFEEFSKKTKTLSAIKNGFDKAMSTILDANITTLIASLLLFVFGSGPIKGFSITLCVGIFTTLFSVYFIARLLTVLYISKNKNKEIVI